MFTPNGFEVSVRVSRIAARSASGEGWVNAVSRPAIYGELKTGVFSRYKGSSAHRGHQLRIRLPQVLGRRPYERGLVDKKLVRVVLVPLHSTLYRGSKGEDQRTRVKGEKKTNAHTNPEQLGEGSCQHL